MLAGVCISAPRKARRRLQLAASGDTHFTITFDSGTPPATVVLGVGDTYAGPAGTEAAAEYDAGDGVWTGYTSNTITLNGDYLKFRGDWRNAAGTYKNMFYSSFQSSAYTCRISGTLGYGATAAYAYNNVFRQNSTVMTLVDNPFQPIIGSPATDMFRSTFSNSGFTGTLPDGTLDTSGLTGSPATDMFRSTFFNSAFTGTLPDGTLDTSGLTGSPATSMFRATFNSSKFTGILPDGTLDTSGLTGSPATDMFYATFYKSKLTGGNLTLGSGITLTSANVVGPLNLMFSGASDWTGQVYWGTTLLTTAIPAPDSDINTFAGCVNMPGYATIDANWK